MIRAASSFQFLPLTTFALLLASAPTARAQGNDRLAPTGGRSALMGNTGVALGRDGAAPFLDPAAIVAIEDQHLAFSVNFFTYAVRHFSQWNQPGPVDTAKFGPLHLDASGDSSIRFRALPSTLCLFFTLKSVPQVASDDVAGRAPRGRQKLAICLGSLEGDDVNLTALSFRGSTPAGSTVQLESIARSWNRLYVGPTYAVELTDRLALGLSLHGVTTSDSFVVDGTSVTSVTPVTMVGGSAVQAALGTAGYGYSFDLVANAGATYRLGKVTLGVSAQLPAVHVLGHFQGTAHSDYSGTQETSTVDTGAGGFSARPPMRIAVGGGVEWPRLTLELDESFDLGSSSAISAKLNATSTSLSGGVVTQTSSTPTYLVDSRPTFNTSLGAEYFVTHGFSLLGGASTNFSTLGGLSPNTSLGNLVQSRTNHVALSFGIGSYGAGADLLIGAQLDYGWGEALAPNPYVLPNSWAVVGTQVYSGMVILAGATSLRAIGRAVEKVENAVTTGVPDNTSAPSDQSPAHPPQPQPTDGPGPADTRAPAAPAPSDTPIFPKRPALPR
jgi:hypothetical protein